MDRALPFRRAMADGVVDALLSEADDPLCLSKGNLLDTLVVLDNLSVCVSVLIFSFFSLFSNSGLCLFTVK
jgi:hypothetical protein